MPSSNPHLARRCFNSECPQRPGFAVVLMFWGVVFAAAGAGAQDWRGRARVQGLVSDENGTPVEGASVTLRLEGVAGKGPAAILTNDRGRWSYLGLTGGPWQVTIEYSGYAVSEGVLPVSEAAANELLRISLEPVTAESVEDSPADADALREAAANAALAKAGQLLEAGQGAEARLMLEEAMASLDSSRHPEVLLRIAQSHFQQGHASDVIRTLERALNLDPDHVESLQLISSILVNEGRQAEAHVYMTRLPKGAKIDPNALLNQGILKYNANDLDGALADFDAIVAGYPDNADGYYYRGLVRMAKGDFEESGADFRKMLELDPGHANAAETKQFLDYLQSQ